MHFAELAQQFAQIFMHHVKELTYYFMEISAFYTIIVVISALD